MNQPETNIALALTPEFWHKEPMKSRARISLALALIFSVSLFPRSASAYVVCSGCRVFGSYTVSGDSADSASGFSSYIAGSSAYSVPGSSAYASYGQQNDYCSRIYDPRYCYQNYYPQVYSPDNSGSDYYVLGGAVYK